MDDLIRRQDAIDAVISLCDECDYGYCGSCRINYPGEKDAKKALEDLPSAQPEQRWIPVSERLPEDVQIGDEYPIVIFCTKEKTYTGFYEYYLGGIWWTADCDSVVDRVLAWMPLPKPWKGVANERTD